MRAQCEESLLRIIQPTAGMEVFIGAVVLGKTAAHAYILCHHRQVKVISIS